MATWATVRTRGRKRVGSRLVSALVVAGTVLAGLALLTLSFFPGSPGCTGAGAAGTLMPRMRVVASRLYAGRRQWRAWGFNWGLGDHSPVIDYFDNPTSANLAVLACELHTAHQLGANSMRIPLELQQVMRGPNATRSSTLTALRRLLDLAAREGVYLDITGNLVWRPQRAPDWYERMNERDRWQVQANFWRAVAHTAAESPAVLCYELTSEPLLSDTPGWYTGEYGGWWFGQIIAHPRARNTHQLVRAWTGLLAAAVRSQDDRPVTIGLMPGIKDGFTPANVADLLDMLVIHQYPQTGRVGEAIAPIRYHASFNKPVLLGETYPLASDMPTQRAFLTRANRYVVGVFEFFDGRDPNHLTIKTTADSLQEHALAQFVTLRRTILKPR